MGEGYETGMIHDDANREERNGKHQCTKDTLHHPPFLLRWSTRERKLTELLYSGESV